MGGVWEGSAGSPPCFPCIGKPPSPAAKPCVPPVLPRTGYDIGITGGVESFPEFQKKVRGCMVAIKDRGCQQGHERARGYQR